LVCEYAIDIISYYSVGNPDTYVGETKGLEASSDVDTYKSKECEISTGCCFFCGHDTFNDILCPTCANNVE